MFVFAETLQRTDPDGHGVWAPQPAREGLLWLDLCRHRHPEGQWLLYHNNIVGHSVHKYGARRTICILLTCWLGRLSQGCAIHHSKMNGKWKFIRSVWTTGNWKIEKRWKKMHIINLVIQIFFRGRAVLQPEIIAFVELNLHGPKPRATVYQQNIYSITK